MAKFYHFTSFENLPFIERDGMLRPGRNTGNRNTYNGIQGDPDFIYLWHPGVIKIIGFLMMLKVQPGLSTEEQVLLEVEIDEGIVERDYDQLLYVFNGNWSEERLQKRLSLQAKDYKLELSEYTPEACRKAIDEASEEQWNKKPGSYRTAENIENFRVVPWREVTSLPGRLFAKVFGPAFLKFMIWAEKRRENK